MSAEWFYLKNRQNLGPFNQDQLRQLAQQGKLLPSDLVWKNGMASWSPASSVPGLLPEMKKAPGPAAPLPAASPNLDRDYQEILSQGWREMVRDSWQAWQGLNPVIKISAISATGLFLVLICLWIVFSRTGGGAAPVAVNSGSEQRPTSASQPQPPTPVEKSPSGSSSAREINAELASKLVGKWQVTEGAAKGGTVEFTRTGTVLLTFRGEKGTEIVRGIYSFKAAGTILLEKSGATTRSEGWLIEIEFIGDDDLNLVNAGDPLGGFGFLLGRLRRIR